MANFNRKWDKVQVHQIMPQDSFVDKHGVTNNETKTTYLRAAK